MKNAFKKAFTGVVAVLTIVSTLGLANVPQTAQAASAGDVIKGTTLSTVYYYGSDGSRYAFPNEKSYFTWYTDFSDVVTLSDSALASIPLAGNIVYRPGSRWIKIQSDPKTYAVTTEGEIRWIETEEVAEGLAGSDWNAFIDDVSDTFFVDYTVGTSLMSAIDGYEGALVADGTTTYMISGGEKLSVSAAGMTANRLQSRFVLDGFGVDLDSMTTGTELTSENTVLTDTAQLGGETVATGGLSVSLASDTAASQTVPSNADSVPFVTYKLTATDGAATLDQFIVKFGGIAATTSLSGVYLYEGNTRLTNSRSINSTTRLATFSSLDLDFTDGETKYLTVRADIADITTGGDSAYLTLVDADSVVTDSDVSGNFPVSGNSMTFSATDAGTVTVTTGGTVSNPTIGEDQATIGKFKFTAATEAASLYQVSFNVNQAVDHSNFTLYNGSDELGTGTVSGDIVTFALSTPVEITKGGDETLTIKADIAGDSADALTVYIEEAADVMATGGTYGFNMAITITAVDTAAEAYSLTLQGGDLTFAFNGPTSTDIAIDTGDQVLLNLTITAANWTELQHLPIIFTAGTVAGDTDGLVNVTATPDEANYTDLTVRLEDGTVWMGPEELSVTGSDTAQTITFDDYQTMQAGESVDVIVTVDVADNSDATFAGSDTIHASLDVSLITADDINGDSLAAANITPSADLTGYNMNVVASSMTISVSSTPSAATYVRGTSGVSMVGYSFAAGQSADITVTDATFTSAADDDGTFTTNVNENDVNIKDKVSSCSAYDGLTGSLIDGPENVTATTYTIVFDNFTWTVEAGETGKMILKCNLANVSPDASNDVDIDNDAYSFFLASNAAVTSEDEEGGSVTETLSAVTVANVSTIPTITVTNSGSLTVAAASDTPTSTAILGSSTDVTVAKYKITSASEAFVVDKVVLTQGGSSPTQTVSDSVAQAVKVSYTNSEGTTETKTAYVTGSLVTFDNMDMYVGKDASAYLSVLVDTNTVDSANLSGATFALSLTTGTDSYFNAVGSGSGTTLDGGDVGNATGNTMTIYKTKPTVSLSSGSPSGSGIPGLAKVLEFNVAADSRGYVTLAGVTFKLTATDNGTTEWFDCVDDTGTDSAWDTASKWHIYKSTDLGTAIDDDADWMFRDTTGTACTGDNQIMYAQVDLAEASSATGALTIEAGTTQTLLLYTDTTGASSSNDDSLRVDLPDEGTMPGTVSYDSTADTWDDAAFNWTDDSYTSDEVYGTLVKTLPLTGGTVVY
jgi:hypothetical protein